MYQFSLLNSVTLSDSNTHKNVYYDIKMDSFKSVQIYHTEMLHWTYYIYLQLDILNIGFF